MSVVLYGSGTWTTNTQDLQLLKTMHTTHLLTMCCKSRRDLISYANLLRKFKMKANIEARVRDCRLRLIHRILNLPPNRLPRIVTHSVSDVPPNCKIGNKPQFKKCVWDDICKFKYSDPTDKKTTFKSQEPPWCKRVRTAGKRVLVSLPGMPVDYIWNRTVCDQRDDVFMTTYWECELAKSQSRALHATSTYKRLKSVRRDFDALPFFVHHSRKNPIVTDFYTWLPHVTLSTLLPPLGPAV